MKNKLCLTGIILLTALTISACGNSKETKKEEDSPKTIQIAAFDTRDDFTNFWLDTGNSGTIGKIEMNNDEQFISEGAGSLKWEMDGVYGSLWNGESYDIGNPMNACFKIYKNTKSDYTDMRDFQYITMDCYNANDFEISFSAFLTGMIDGASYSLDNNAITIQPGEWGNLRITLDKYGKQKYSFIKEISILVNYDYCVAQEDTEMVKKGELYFPKGVVYLDNVRAVVGKEETTDKVFADDNELLYFDSIQDMQYAATYMANGELSWNERDTRFGTGVSSQYITNPEFTNGKKGALMLRVDNVNNMCNNWRRSYVYSGSYSELQVGVEFKGFFDDINFLALQNGYKLAVDVYNGFDYDKEVYFGCDDAVTGYNYFRGEEYPYAIGKNTPLSSVYRLKAGEWTTIYFEENEQLDLSQGLSRIRLATSRVDVFDTGCLYINNLRMVKEAE